MRNDFKFDLVLVCRNGGYDVVVGTVIKAKVQDKKGNIHDKKGNCGLVWMDGGRAVTCVLLRENDLHVSSVNR